MTLKQQLNGEKWDVEVRHLNKLHGEKWDVEVRHLNNSYMVKNEM